MGRDIEIRQALAGFAAQYGPQHTQLLKVESTDIDALTCECTDDEGVEYLVRLSPIITNGQSLVITPKVGKQILVTRFEDSEDWYISWAEQWQKVTYTIGKCTFESDGEKLTIKNQDANLLDVITNVIEAVQRITVLYGSNPDYAKLSDARTLLNKLLQ